MPERVLAGSALTLAVTAQLRDTLRRAAGVPVFLDRQDQPAGPWAQVGAGETGADGQVTVQLQLPDVAGTLRFRARTPGVAERYRADTSPVLTVELVALPA